MSDTKVLEIINELGVFPQEWRNRDDVDQRAIDNIQLEVLSRLTPGDIAAHNCFAYSNSVAEYDSKLSNALAVPELPRFMDLIREDGLVLDLGAGHLRDTLYMVDPSSRDALNRENMVPPSLEKRLRVIPLEKSFGFLNECSGKLVDNMERVPLIVEGDFMTPGMGEAYGPRDEELSEVFTGGKLRPVLDGIWSCAAYMVHMAPGQLGRVTEEWAKSLNSGGVFAVSYIDRKEDQGEMKLLASRSAPGEIKIFSHYNSDEVDGAFREAGLKLINSSSGDYDGHGHVMSDFFGSAMYRKE